MPTRKQMNDLAASRISSGITAQHGLGSEHEDYIPSKAEQFIQENKVPEFDQKRLAAKRDQLKDIPKPQTP